MKKLITFATATSLMLGSMGATAYGSVYGYQYGALVWRGYLH